ncbi:hypothetical protein IT781_18840 [Methylobacter sp. BlB1]|nr:hypothetical protein [Methylobacter sp. BlB1]
MILAGPPAHVFIRQTTEFDGTEFDAFGFVFLRFKNGTIAPDTSILLTPEGFGFDTLTGFGKYGAITGFPALEINFDDVEIKHLCILVLESIKQDYL